MPLAAQLGLPLIAKDTIKDALMEVLGAPTVDASRAVGTASVMAMLAVARQCPGAVLESVWHRTRARADLASLPGDIVEVFCRCDREVVRARYRRRAGTRAAGHFDNERTDAELWNDENAVPVAGGWPVIEVDTTDDLVDFPTLASEVRRAHSREVASCASGRDAFGRLRAEQRSTARWNDRSLEADVLRTSECGYSRFKATSLPLFRRLLFEPALGA